MTFELVLTRDWTASVTKGYSIAPPKEIMESLVAVAFLMFSNDVSERLECGELFEADLFDVFPWAKDLVRSWGYKASFRPSRAPESAGVSSLFAAEAGPAVNH